jgi:hypothetical protein
MAKIEGIMLPTSLGASLGGSPEDAAKAFMKAATEGLAVVVRNALVDAVGSSVGAGATPDWTKLVTGCNMNVMWATPPGTSMQTTTAFAVPKQDVLGSISISIGITGSF